MTKESLNLSIDDGYKEKLRNIADNKNRSMAGQVQHWIDQVKPE